MKNPTHGERTKNGIWLDETAFQEPLEDPRQGVNIPDCDDVTCSYSFVENASSPNPVELTYNAEYGLWLCPTHWAELEAEAATTPPPMHTYELPRLITYGNLRELQGRGLG